ncbi:hypothetical protein HPP92_011285 [Vanilla planifolia]|uniref:Kinetochore protein SPC25 n=1 Tax=Vanilla planifolia TaxID=51239 RepID=A0A835R0E9_VANPL|nr:hypothetical protein HPP92_011588 [Vanilla planifolia]KAG0483201.1 hypothetical protein HPP92_011285 [Vanilla planifolia]
MEAESTRAKMEKLRMSCQLEIRACRERSGLLFGSIRQSLKSIKPLFEDALGNRGTLAKVKDELKEVEACFRGTLKVNASKEAKHAAIGEALSSTDARIELLKKTVQEQKAKKEEYEAVLSQQLLVLEKIEEKNEVAIIESKKIQEATEWYKNFLGFHAEGGEGVKFIFSKIDPKNYDKEYSFVVRLDGDRYTLLDCDPQVDGIDGLVEELNRTNGLFKFVRVVRGKFQEIACQVPAMIAISTPPPNSMDSRTDTLTNQDGLSLRSRRHPRGSHRKVVPAQAVILSSPSVLASRRSPRFKATNLP